jgi:TfoX/Sxy family transcriptional regulator of competence genes
MCAVPVLLLSRNLKRKGAEFAKIRRERLCEPSCAWRLCVEINGGKAVSYDEGLAERLREVFVDVPDVVEKKMFGGLCMMVSGNMCCGIVDETLMARVGPDQYFQCLELPSAREMDFTGKPLKGMIYVDPEGISEDDDLQGWVNRCMSFMKLLPPKQPYLLF